MTNPAEIVCTGQAWTKVAESVTGGFLRILDHSSQYLYTQRDTGNPAPTAGDHSEGAIFEGDAMPISNVTAIDVYIWATETGLMRYDAQ